MGLFKLDTPTPKSEEKTIVNARNDRTVSRSLKLENIHTHRVEDIDRDICSDLAPGEAHFILTTNKINMRTFLYWILKNSGENHIDELVISTYSVSTATSEMLRDLILKDLAGKITLIVCDHFLKLKDPRYFHIRAICEDHGIKLLFRDNHSKILLARSASRRIVLFGSGNFADNAHVEEYFLIDDGRIFDFYREALLSDCTV